MGIYRKAFCSAFLCVLFFESLHDVEAAEDFVETQKILNGLDIIRRSETDLDATSLANLDLIESSIEQDPEVAKMAMAQFVSESILKAGSGFRGEITPSNLADFVISQDPTSARVLFSNFVDSMTVALSNLNEGLKNTKLDLISSTDQKISFRLNSMLAAADARVFKSFEDLKTHLSNANAEKLIIFRHQRSHLVWLYNNFIEAKVHRMQTAQDWAGLIEQGISDFLSNGAFPRLRQSQIQMKSILQEELRIGTSRAWVNRDTITAGAMAAVVAAQGVCIFVTVGICAVTLPATSSWIITGGRIALSAAQIEVTGMSLINLIDRYRFEGLSGLVSVGSLIDALVVASAIPQPGLSALGSTRSFSAFGKSISVAGVSARLGQAQLKTMISLSAISGGYGVWQILNANAIALRLQRSGQNVDANSIRTQGCVHIMLGMLGGLKAYSYYSTVLKNSPQYESYIRSRDSLAVRYTKSFQRLLPQRSFGNIYRGIRATPQSFGLGMKMIGAGVGYLTYQTVFGGALALASYTYPDFVMRKRNRPLPDLRDGEGALLLNGFSSNDILYYAFASDYANRFEIEKYGDRLGAAFFDSSKDFFKKIETYAKKYGKIRYLKVMAHGVPGRIVPVATQDVMDGSEHDLIDREMIEANKAWIRKIAHKWVASDAQIVIISCLVGGNLDKATEYRGLQFEEKSGDNLIRAIGENLLVNGGSIDSSRRIIMGMEGAFGSLWDHALYQSMKDLPLKEDIEAYNAEVRRSFDREEEPSIIPITTTMAERLVRMYSQIWSIVYKFGYNLEGNFFSDRHRYDSFPAQTEELSKIEGNRL